MRAAARTTNLVAADAELLAGAAMTTRAGDGIHPRRRTVAVTTATSADPSARMRTHGTGAPRADTLARVALLARDLRVTRDAETRLPARL